MNPVGVWIGLLAMFRAMQAGAEGKRKRLFDSFMEKALHGKNLKDH
jgi:hypothetical protein